jgi:hypothetical protein
MKPPGPGQAGSFEVPNLHRPEHEKPLRDLLVRLPQLRVDEQGRLDLRSSSPSLVREIADHAERAVQAINLGTAAIGAVLPFAAPDIEDGTVAMGTVEALGWLLSELGEAAATLLVLAAACRQAHQAP